MQASDFPYLSRPFAAIAHRGGSLVAENLGIENTMLAFRNAVERGYSYVETDVHVTADGTLVVFHDEDVSRVTGKTGLIGELSSADLRQILVGGTEPIPTLDQLLESLPDVMVNIDMKAPGVVAPLVDTIKRHRAQHRVCVASFSVARLHRFRKLIGQEVATAASPLGIGWSAFLPMFIRFLHSEAPVWQIPLDFQKFGRTWQLFGPRMLDELHKLGKKVHIWTIDDAETMHRLIDLGVDGIVTDRPDTLRQVLMTRGMWYS